MLNENQENLLRDQQSRSKDHSALKDLITELQYKDLSTRHEIEATRLEIRRLEDLINKVETSKVSNEAFQPIRNLHYAIITAVLLAVVAAVMSSILNKPLTPQPPQPYIIPRADYSTEELKPKKNK